MAKITKLKLDNFRKDLTLLWLRKWNDSFIQFENKRYNPNSYLYNQTTSAISLEVLNQTELKWSKALTETSAKRYKSSRRIIRQLLAPVLNCTPQQVPLDSPPGKIPRLNDNCGYISLSHSGYGTLLGWSLSPIGVDIENSARSLESSKICKRFFPLNEQKSLQCLEGEELRRTILQSWVSKEAAIKWQHGKLSKDLKNWHWDYNSKQLKQLSTGIRPWCFFKEQRGWFCALVCSQATFVRWC